MPSSLHRSSIARDDVIDRARVKTRMYTRVWTFAIVPCARESINRGDGRTMTRKSAKVTRRAPQIKARSDDDIDVFG
jgi:hypothetical protein